MRNMVGKALGRAVAVFLSLFCIWVTFDVTIRSSIEGSWSALDIIPRVPTSLLVFGVIAFGVMAIAFAVLFLAERLDHYNEGQNFSVPTT